MAFESLLLSMYLFLSFFLWMDPFFLLEWTGYVFKAFISCGWPGVFVQYECREDVVGDGGESDCH